MKKKLLVAVLTAFALASCSEKMEDKSSVSDEKVSLRINVSEGMTKVNNTASEGTLHDYQVFVFNDRKQLEAYEYMTEGLTFTMDLMKGTKYIHVICNAPKIEGVRTYDGLCGFVSMYKDNSIDRFVMEGAQKLELTSSTEETTIEVNRVISKISLVSVTNRLEGAYEGMSIELKKAYLINVAGDHYYNYLGTLAPVPSIWYHQRGYVETDGISSLTYANYNEVLSYSSPYTDHRQDFYCYPNPTEKDSSSEDWSARYTRLVVEAEISGIPSYYPLSVTDIQPNHNYEISLTITRPGSGHPDVPCDTESALFEMKVMPWTVKTIEEKI